VIYVEVIKFGNHLEKFDSQISISDDDDDDDQQVRGLFIIIISLLMSPLLGHRYSLWISHKENGP
jgi:hypothetical protein